MGDLVQREHPKIMVEYPIYRAHRAVIFAIALRLVVARCSVAYNKFYVLLHL